MVAPLPPVIKHRNTMNIRPGKSPTALMLIILLLIPASVASAKAAGCRGTREPVCGSNNITFLNECIAKAQDVGVVYAGECRGDSNNIDFEASLDAIRGSKQDGDDQAAIINKNPGGEILTEFPAANAHQDPDILNDGSGTTDDKAIPESVIHRFKHQGYKLVGFAKLGSTSSASPAESSFEPVHGDDSIANNVRDTGMPGTNKSASEAISGKDRYRSVNHAIVKITADGYMFKAQMDREAVKEVVRARQQRLQANGKNVKGSHLNDEDAAALLGSAFVPEDTKNKKNKRDQKKSNWHRNLLQIWGGDNREKCPIPAAGDMPSFPYSAIGQIDSAGVGSCSATLINKRTIITAAHCIYKQNGVFASSVWFAPGRHRAPQASSYTDPFNSYGGLVDSINIFQGYINTPKAAEYDVAMVILKDEVNVSVTGSLGFQVNCEADQHTITTGYPGSWDKGTCSTESNNPNECKMASDIQCDAQMMINGCDTESGQSGSALYLPGDHPIATSRYRITGILNGGYMGTYWYHINSADYDTLLMWATEHLDMSCTTLACAELIPQGRPNLALAKPSSQSSMAFGGTADRGNDGNKNGAYNAGGTCMHSDPQDANPSWYVDLEASKPIGDIILFNRNDCCQDTFADMEVYVTETPLSDFSQHEPCAIMPTYAHSQPVAALNCGGAVGKFVTVRMTGDHSLVLCEVEIYEAPCTTLACADLIPQGRPNLALAKPSSQSSMAFGGTADRGNDGEKNGDYYAGTCMHSDPQDANPSWYVDLEASKPVGDIVLFNRDDCCPHTFTDLEVYVTETPISDFSQHEPCAIMPTYAHSQRVAALNCGGAVGKFVTIRMAGDHVLSLCEVEVYEAPCNKYTCGSGSTCNAVTGKCEDIVYWHVAAAGGDSCHDTCQAQQMVCDEAIISSPVDSEAAAAAVATQAGLSPDDYILTPLSYGEEFDGFTPYYWPGGNDVYYYRGHHGVAEPSCSAQSTGGRKRICPCRPKCGNDFPVENVHCTSDVCCEQLTTGTPKFDLSKGTNPWVCSESYVYSPASPACENTADFLRAKDICQGLGSRLCTLADLQTGEAAGTGCGHDYRLVWTSDPCHAGNSEDGFVVAKGLDGAQPECKTLAEVAAVRCCGDLCN